jgi:hypothetical protein
MSAPLRLEKVVIMNFRKNELTGRNSLISGIDRVPIVIDGKVVDESGRARIGRQSVLSWSTDKKVVSARFQENG